MFTNDKKTSAFIQEINNEADKKCNKIKSEVDEYIKSELKKAREEAKEYVKPYITTELDSLNEQTNTSLYKIETEQITLRTQKRAEITDRVFDKAKQKLLDFSESDDYKNYLLKSIEEALAVSGNNSVTIIREKDKKYADLIKNMCKKIEYSKDIIIGGCICRSDELSIIANNTIDIKLQAQKENFYAASGLSITL